MTQVTTGVKPSGIREGRVLTGKWIAEKFFAGFQTRKNPERIEMLCAAVKFCVDMASPDVPPYWIVFLGRSGIGKTYLLRMIANFFERCVAYMADERLSRGGNRYSRRGGIKEWNEALNEMIGLGDYSGQNQLKEDWFVALDDIGAEYERNQALSASKLYEVLSKREGKFTVITANRSVQQIGETLDVRIASRLLRHGSVVLDPKGLKDYNIPGYKE